MRDDPTINEKVKRLRPRVELDIELPDDGSTRYPFKTLPFVIGVLGDFAGRRDPGPLLARRFRHFDRDLNFDRIRASVAPVPPGTDDAHLGASWRALGRLANETDTGWGTQIQFCPLTKDELRADVMGVSDPRDSWLYRTVCLDAFGASPGLVREPGVDGALNPFAVMICDYAFDAHDAPLLARLDRIGAAGLTVMIAAPPAELPGQAHGTQRAHPQGLRYVAWVTHKIPPAEPEVSAAWGLARDLGNLSHHRGWCAAIDWPGAAWHIDPPRLGALLCATRFARHLACLLVYHREHLATQAALSACANHWLARYVMSHDEARDVVIAARPLRSARVELIDDPARPDVAGLLTLEPGYQVDGATRPICLTVPRPPLDQEPGSPR